MADLDRLRGRDDGRPALEGPQLDHPSTTRAAHIGILALMVVVALGLWWWTAQRPSPMAEVAQQEAPASVEPTHAATTGLGIGEPDPNLPSLAEMDGYVRPILAVLSARPELAALLASDDLVRRFVVSVESIARGGSPARQVQAVAPRGRFDVQRTDEGYVIAPGSYQRYDGLVRMVADLEPQDLARIYGRLKPRLEEAHAELGVSASLDDTMASALAHLLETPTLPARARVQPGKGTNYVYADPAIEGLSAAQRQLLRLGPERAARVKARLLEFARALGIDESRLPSST